MYIRLILLPVGPKKSVYLISRSTPPVLPADQTTHQFKFSYIFVFIYI